VRARRRYRCRLTGSHILATAHQQPDRCMHTRIPKRMRQLPAGARPPGPPQRHAQTASSPPSNPTHPPPHLRRVPGWCACVRACSFIYQDDALRPVPASKADIFKDKRLGLNDKRQLMRFISSCMAAGADPATHGSGTLQVWPARRQQLAGLTDDIWVPLRGRAGPQPHESARSEA
jgi:hypothetical protein